VLLFIACNDKPKTQAVSRESKDAVPSIENSAERELSENTRERTAINDFFATESDWKGVKCKEYYEAGGYTNIQECVFPNANLQQVYDIAKKVDTNLKNELPATNFEYSPAKETGCLSVDYKYKSEKHLFVELSYNGGVIYIEIVEDEDSTQAKITDSAD
jgi:uncharacterized protein YuzE